MLNFLGTIAGNALGLPGILGLALGMLTRNPFIAGILGAAVGLAETLVFAGFSFARVETLELVIALCVGVLASLIGCGIRVKGTTV